MSEDGTPIGGVIHAWRAAPDTSGDPMIRPDWHALAACGRNGVLGDDPARRVRIMFPNQGGDTSYAMSICEQCPVSDTCATAGADELRGIWGHTSGRTRRRGVGPVIGSRDGIRNFTPDQVRHVRLLLAQGNTQTAVADMTGKSVSVISKIANGQTYQDVV